MLISRSCIRTLTRERSAECATDATPKAARERDLTAAQKQIAPQRQKLLLSACNKDLERVGGEKKCKAGYTWAEGAERMLKQRKLNDGNKIKDAKILRSAPDLISPKTTPHVPPKPHSRVYPNVKQF